MAHSLLILLLFICSIQTLAGGPPVIRKTYEGIEGENFLWRIAVTDYATSSRQIVRDSMTSYDRSCSLEVKKDEQNHCSMDLDFNFCIFPLDAHVEKRGYSGGVRFLSVPEFAKVIVAVKSGRGLRGLRCKEYRD